jgi:hypothetical protein
MSSFEFPERRLRVYRPCFSAPGCTVPFDESVPEVHSISKMPFHAWRQGYRGEAYLCNRAAGAYRYFKCVVLLIDEMSCANLGRYVMSPSCSNRFLSAPVGDAGPCCEFWSCVVSSCPFEGKLFHQLENSRIRVSHNDTSSSFHAGH